MLAFYTREVVNFCKVICRFCLKLAEVWVNLEVPHASKYEAITDHVCAILTNIHDWVFLLVVAALKSPIHSLHAYCAPTAILRFFPLFRLL